MARRALSYLLTRAGATQVSDDLTAVCDYYTAGSVMMKQLTDSIQHSFTEEDVLKSNRGNTFSFLNTIVNREVMAAHVTAASYQLQVNILRTLLCGDSYFVWWM